MGEREREREGEGEREKEKERERETKREEEEGKKRYEPFPSESRSRVYVLLFAAIYTCSFFPLKPTALESLHSKESNVTEYNRTEQRFTVFLLSHRRNKGQNHNDLEARYYKKHPEPNPFN